MANVIRACVAVTSGLLLAAGFPPVGIWPLSIAGVMLSCLLFSPQCGTRFVDVPWLGGLMGLGFFVPLLTWLNAIGSDAWLLLSIFLSLWFVLMAPAIRLVMCLRWWPLWVAATWVTQEAVRTRLPFGGFGWGRLAFSQSEAPSAHWAYWAGAAAVSFVTALIGTLLAWAILNRHGSRVRVSAAVIAALALALVSAPRLFLPPATAPTTAAVVQGSVPRSGLDALGQREAVLNNHVLATVQLAQRVQAGTTPQPSFVVWPENSSDIDPTTDRQAGALVTSAAKAVNAPILVGTRINNPVKRGTLWNVGIVWQPDGSPSQLYAKRQLVPFGEFLPFRAELTQLVTRFDRIPIDFAPGSTPGVLSIGGSTIGDVICFEVSNDHIVGDVFRNGAQLLVVQTNNATYAHTGIGGTAQPEQQLAMTRLRAIEHARPALIAATSGVTAVLDDEGREVARVPMFESGSRVATVTGRSGLTPGERVGQLPEWLLIGLTIGALIVAATRRHSRRPEDSGAVGSNDVLFTREDPAGG